MTDQEKMEIFFEFTDEQINGTRFLTLSAFKDAMTKALSIYGVVKSLPTKQDMWNERGKQFTKIKESNTELSKHTPHLLGFALGFEKCYEWLTK